MDPNFSLMHCVNVTGYISILERYIVFLCILCFKPTKYFAIDLIQLLCLLSLMFLSYNYVIICTFFLLFLTAVYHYSIFHISAINFFNDRTQFTSNSLQHKKNLNKIHSAGQQNQPAPSMEVTSRRSRVVSLVRYY